VQRTWIAASVIVVAIGAGLWLWKGSSSASSSSSAAPASPQATAPTATSSSTTRTSVTITAPAPTLDHATPDAPGAVVKADQVIARINGTPITGRQLVAFGADAEHTMTKEMFDYLRRRAIDRELTFQAAKAAGIELTTAQLAELDQVRTNATEHGVTDIDLQVADARAGLLQSALLAKATTVAAPTGDAVDRQQLADEAQADYATKLRAYLDDLAAKATITN
jgi:hypothetical protein